MADGAARWAAMHMMYVDESGDPGFGSGSSDRYVRVGAIVHAGSGGQWTNPLPHSSDRGDSSGPTKSGLRISGEVRRHSGRWSLENGLLF